MFINFALMRKNIHIPVKISTPVEDFEKRLHEGGVMFTGLAL